MAKKQNGRELLRIDNDSYRRDNALCREILAKERAEIKRLRSIVSDIDVLATRHDADERAIQPYEIIELTREALSGKGRL